MKLKKVDISMKDAIDLSCNDSIILKRRENRLLLSDYQISVLERNGFNYLNYNNIKNLLFDIEELLNQNYDEELDVISDQIAELIYYDDFKK